MFRGENLSEEVFAFTLETRPAFFAVAVLDDNKQIYLIAFLIK